MTTKEPPLFLSIHQLVAYPGGRPLNCGEDGLPKTLTLAGTERTRISSQSAKRALRTAVLTRTLPDQPPAPDSLTDLGRSIGVPPSVRTRRIVDHALLPALAEAEIEDGRAWAEAITRSFGGADEDGLAQPVVLGRGDVDRLIRAVKAALAAGVTPAEAVTTRNNRIVVHAELRNAIKAIAPQAQDAGLDGALFGRMATSELLDRADAAVKVGHAMSTGPHRIETDFFATVDDYGEGGPGAAHINNKPLTSALFYRHTLADVSALEAGFPSLSRSEVAAVVAWLVRALYRVGLTQRLAGDAGAQVPVELIVDLTCQQPYSAALAYEVPVETRAQALAALDRELATLDGRGGAPLKRLRIADFSDQPQAAIDALSDSLADLLSSGLA